MSRLAPLLFFTLLLNACGPIVDVKFVKNPTPKEAPSEKPGVVEPSLYEISLKETEDGTKNLVLNADVSPAFASAVGLGSNACVQVVELSDGMVVVDFGKVVCPDSGILNKENIMFTLRYIEPENPLTEPFLMVLSKDEHILGSASATSTTTVMMTDLCTGDYTGTCELTIKDGTFNAFKELK